MEEFVRGYHWQMAATSSLQNQCILPRELYQWPSFPWTLKLLTRKWASSCGHIVERTVKRTIWQDHDVWKRGEDPVQNLKWGWCDQRMPKRPQQRSSISHVVQPTTHLLCTTVAHPLLHVDMWDTYTVPLAFLLFWTLYVIKPFHRPSILTSLMRL